MASRVESSVATSRDAPLRYDDTGRRSLLDPSTQDIEALRAEHGFVTPLPPLEEGDCYCVFSTDTMWEWLFHPADARRYLTTGIRVDGVDCAVTEVDRHPFMNAVQLRAAFPSRNGSLAA